VTRSPLESIAAAIYSDETPAVLGCESELAAHAAHMSVERARSDQHAATPHPFADLVTRKQLPCVTQKED